MTREKENAAGQTATGLAASQEPSRKATGTAAANRKQTEKLSREALALQASNLRDRKSGHMESKLPEPDQLCRGVHRGKKGKSAPPAPEFEADKSQRKDQPEQGVVLLQAVKPASRKATGTKHTELADEQPDTDTARDASKDKKRKAGRDTDHGQQEQGGDGVEVKRSIGDKGMDPMQRVDTGQDDGTSDQSKKRRRRSKSKDKSRREGQDTGADGPVPGGASTAAGENPTNSQVAGGSGAAHKRDSKANAVTAAQDAHTATLRGDKPETAAAAKQAALVPSATAPVPRMAPAAARTADPAGAQVAKPPAVATGAPQQAAIPGLAAESNRQQHQSQQPAPARGRERGVPAGPSVPAAAPHPARLTALPQCRGPAEAVPGAAANVAWNGVAGVGASGSCGSAALPEGEAAAAQTAAAVAAAAARPLPPTGTTPVKAFAPVAMPRLDEVGKRDRSEIIELQRQLTEVRALYDELKNTKIQDLEKVLAEQVEFTEEQVRHADMRARRWQAAAERAQQEAREAGSKETANRIEALEAEVERLIKENSELMFRMVEQQGELARTQQAYHDLRAELLQREMRATGAEGGGDAGEGEGNGMELDQLPREGADAEGVSATEGQGPEGDGAEKGQPEISPVVRRRSGAATPSVSMATMLPSVEPHAGRAVGMQFPTPSPGIGVQFPTPGLNFMHLQGLFGGMLAMPGSGSRSQGPGVSTECQRVVQMLPTLRVPSPSIRSCLTSGAAQQGVQADVAQTGAGNAMGITPSAAVTQPEQLATLGPASKSRSSGSPIDGICGADQRKAGGVNTAANVSFAPGMCSPKAHMLSPKQKEQYSFVDLNPASARKAERPMGVVTGLLAAADGNRLQQVAQLTAGSGVAHGAMSPKAMGLTLSPGVRPNGQAPAFGTGGAASGLAPSTAAAMAAIHSGSVASNQDSCEASGLVARAMMHLEELRRGASALQDPSPNKQATQGAAQVAADPAHGNHSPVLASRRRSLLPPSPLGREAAERHQMERAASVAEASKAAEPSRPPLPQQSPSIGPTPRTAKLMLYEQVMDWHAESVSVKPEACRMTHNSTGLSFELREVELDDKEVEAELSAAGNDAGPGAKRSKTYIYTPLSFGTIGTEHLPEFLKEKIHVPEAQRRNLLVRLDKAIMTSLAAKKK